jgi:hypothetical protein
MVCQEDVYLKELVRYIHLDLLVVKARRAMSWIGVRKLGYSGADVARYWCYKLLRDANDINRKETGYK